MERAQRRGETLQLVQADPDVEMGPHQPRVPSQRLLEAVAAVAEADAKTRKRAIAAAQETYAEIQRTVTDDDDAGKALRLEEKLRRFRKWRTREDLILSSQQRQLLEEAIMELVRREL